MKPLKCKGLSWMKEEAEENGERTKINRTLKEKKKNRYYTYIVSFDQK